MPTFKTLDGQTLQYGQEETYLPDDEKAFILSLDKQVRAADLENETHISSLKWNFNQIAKLLGGPSMPVDGMLTQDISDALSYYSANRDLFIEHGITEHFNARKLAQTISPAESVYAEGEYPGPTIDEMKSLEVDIGKLYED
tara:strand:- start:1711 stop:2136 length:426 start_codon:yes stop_codon:yes gene_type:complete